MSKKMNIQVENLEKRISELEEQAKYAISVPQEEAINDVIRSLREQLKTLKK